MNQIAIDFTANAPRCMVPPPDTKAGVLLRAMQEGRRFTIENAGRELGVGALSQECGRLKHRWGWGDMIKREMIVTVTGSRIAQYWLDME